MLAQTLITTYDVLMNESDSAVVVNHNDLPLMPKKDILDIEFPAAGGILINLDIESILLIDKSDEGDIERFLKAKGEFLLVSAEPDKDEPLDLWLCKA